jgi:uncharacterized Zn finger protein (UPF0148 family)
MWTLDVVKEVARVWHCRDCNVPLDERLGTVARCLICGKAYVVYTKEEYDINQAAMKSRDRNK